MVEVEQQIATGVGRADTESNAGPDYIKQLRDAGRKAAEGNRIVRALDDPTGPLEPFPRIRDITPSTWRYWRNPNYR